MAFAHIRHTGATPSRNLGFVATEGDMDSEFDRSRKTRHQRLPVTFTGVEPTKVLSVSNSQSFTEQVSKILSEYRRIRLLAGASDRTQAAERVVLLKPDVVVIEADLDYELGGIDTAFALRAISPTTAFVLISPHSDPEHLAMIPRGLGLEWSYVLSDGEINAEDLAAAITSAAWSIPFIDHRIDQSLLGSFQENVQKAVDKVLRAKERHRPSRRPGRAKDLGYLDSDEWDGKVQRFRLSEDTEDGDGPDMGA